MREDDSVAGRVVAAPEATEYALLRATRRRGLPLQDSAGSEPRTECPDHLERIGQVFDDVIHSDQATARQDRNEICVVSPDDGDPSARHLDRFALVRDLESVECSAGKALCCTSQECATATAIIENDAIAVEKAREAPNAKIIADRVSGSGIGDCVSDPQALQRAYRTTASISYS